MNDQPAPATKHKLHLGCGARYLDGYVNVDLPQANHTVLTPMPDVICNITDLRRESGSVTEVRLHHVFEHFSRAQAVALLLVWQEWLCDGGTVQIEVPDFQRSARAALSWFRTERSKSVASRHIFGSQEAVWADHKAGYTASTLRALMTCCGLTVRRVRRTHWRGTYNLDVVGEKCGRGIAKWMWPEIATAYLKRFLVDEGESESRLLQVWQHDVQSQFQKSGF